MEFLLPFFQGAGLGFGIILLICGLYIGFCFVCYLITENDDDIYNK